MPSWIVWSDLSDSEEATLRRMWNESVDHWLTWALGFLDTEPSGTDFSVSWDLRFTYITSRQLTELREIPAGDERRECLYEMLREPADRSLRVRFQGVVRAAGNGALGIETGDAPTIDIQVDILGRSATVQFDIDTGSAVTILSDGDASRLLGVEHGLVEFQADAQRIGLRGLTGLTEGTMLEAQLTLRS